jgi:hypothetical protein
MCLAVYLATSSPQQTTAWNKDQPAFYLADLYSIEEVRGQFSLPYVYYAGSHEGCGCGYRRDGVTGEELAQTNATYAALSKLIRDAKTSGASAELFSCWEGDQQEKPEFIGAVTVSELESPEFEFKELQFLTVA